MLYKKVKLYTVDDVEIDHKVYKSGALIKEIALRNNGMVKLDLLPFGRYVIKEPISKYRFSLATVK